MHHMIGEDVSTMQEEEDNNYVQCGRLIKYFSFTFLFSFDNGQYDDDFILMSVSNLNLRIAKNSAEKTKKKN